MNTTLTESIILARLNEYDVRVWREEALGFDYDEKSKKNTDFFIKFIHTLDGQPLKKIAETILQSDKVSAVEVKDKAGNGIVLYKSWP